MASLQLTSSSHPQVTKITGNKVEFQFENINLPAEIDDAPGSNGYVAFKIKTKNNLVMAIRFRTSGFFFDFFPKPIPQLYCRLLGLRKHFRVFQIRQNIVLLQRQHHFGAIV